MSRYSSEGTCDCCGASFRYFLVDNDVNDSAYGYCDSCGATLLVSGSYQAIPPEVRLETRGPISEHTAKFLQRCACGGVFRGDASPRCPQCRAELAAETAAGWIEAGVRGAGGGRRWQRSWRGAYCIVIENRLEQDNWRR